MSIFHHRFNSVAECIQSCDRAWQEGRRCYPANAFIHNVSWVGRDFGSWEQVKKACNEWWTEGLDIIQEMIFELDREGQQLPTPIDRRRKRKYLPDDGDEIEYDRFRSGQDYWDKAVRMNLRGPQFLSLFINVSTKCSRTPEEILWRGAAAIVLSDLLEKVGYRVEITAMDYVHRPFESSKPEHGCFSVKLKEAREPLDVATLTNAVSGWFYRTVMGFQIMHTQKQYIPMSSYGYPQLLTKDLSVIQELTGAGSTPVIVDDVWNRHAAMELIRSIIMQLNSGS